MFAFTFEAGNDSPASFGMRPAPPPAAFINPADLYVERPDDLPAQEPMHGSHAAYDHESIRDMVPQNASGFMPQSPPTLANPPANPVWQGAALTPTLHQPQQIPAFQQPGIDQHHVRDDVPTTTHDFLPERTDAPADYIPAAQGATPSGPGRSLQVVDHQTEMGMRAQGRRRAEERKLGPRAPKRRVEEAAPEEQMEPPVKKSRRPGPKKAAPGQLKYNWCRNEHLRRCGPTQECVPDCPLKEHWPDVWERENHFIDVISDETGQVVRVKELFKALHKDLDGYKGKGRRGKSSKAQA